MGLMPSPENAARSPDDAAVVQQNYGVALDYSRRA